MLLYHGTNAERANAALSEGIKPRLHFQSNWPEKPSRNDCVYLTESYGATYAIRTSKQANEPDKAECAIIEIDVPDNGLLLPDEDFLSECVWMAYFAGELSEAIGMKMDEALRSGIRNSLEIYADTDWLHVLREKHKSDYRPICHKFVDFCAKHSGKPSKGFDASLFALGTCAYKGTIPPGMIRRVAYFVRSHSVVHSYFAGCVETSIAWHRRDNHHLESAEYNKWIFGDDLKKFAKEKYKGIRVVQIGLGP